MINYFCAEIWAKILKSDKNLPIPYLRRIAVFGLN